MIAAIPTGQPFEPLMTLYLTDNTSPEDIISAEASQFVKAVKYYPAGATTNSEFWWQIQSQLQNVISNSCLFLRL